MTPLNRIAATAAVWGFLAPYSSAQAPPNQPQQAQPYQRQQAQPYQRQQVQPYQRQQAQPYQRQQAPQAPSARRPATQPPQGQSRTAYRPTQYQQPNYGGYGTSDYRNHPGSRSVLRHYPSTPPDSSYGFRNPGGVGRFAEYYPPGNQFQNGGRDPVAHAGFDQNIPVGSISEQAMAVGVGTERYAVMQQHMDNFARPMGFGFGVGFF